MRTYCTLFDRNYIAKGLAMYRSLERHSSEDFLLYIIALDNETVSLLGSFNLEKAKVISLVVLETMIDLKAVRANRSWKEYCWTLASNSAQLLLKSLYVDMITYLDSDLFFYSDPKIVFDEIGDRSIAITPHRFPEEKRYMERNGIYNVGLVSFRKDGPGIVCANKWAAQCRDWCYARNEEGRFADQAYLDSWPSEYPGRVCAIENIGVNAAPWNVSRYEVSDGPKLDGVPLVAYHFHEYEHKVRLTYYKISKAVVDIIYRPYVRANDDALAELAGTCAYSSQGNFSTISGI